MLIDTHAHLNFKAFNKDWSRVLDRAVKSGVTKIINVGAKLDSSRLAVDMAQKDEHLFAAVGFHPLHIDEYTESVVPEIRDLAKKPRVVAIGETGIDLKEHPESLPEQQKAFSRFIDAARDLDLPLIVHIREAYDQALELLESMKEEKKPYKGVIHCFGGDWLTAEKFLDLGFLISFTGILTFVKENEPMIEAAKQLPLDKVMVETDCPYLAPVSKRGKRCEPADCREVADKIAALKGVEKEEVYKKTTENAERLFSLDH